MLAVPSVPPVHCGRRLCFILGMFECLLCDGRMLTIVHVLIHLILTTMLHITNVYYPPFISEKEQRG